ncbi:MAG: 2-dehydropantoate 2-reductase [Subtercola sp.]|nr:2-dehydropantoate 2-reductase [Subtercola sp.]
MRLLVVGAGAVGGYFGGRLLAAGRDVTFLVRPARAAALAADGLVVHTLGDDSDLFVPIPVTVQADELADAGPFDAVLLSVKAYALEQALDDLAPAIGAETFVVPALNGLRHVDVLRERFGDQHVVGGVCVVAAQLDPDGSIRQVGVGNSWAYGEFDGSVSDRMLELDSSLTGAGFGARISQTIDLDMWEKWVMLASGGALTTLLRSTVGPIVAAPGGLEVATAIAEECFAVATAAGFGPREKQRVFVLGTLTAQGSSYGTSMFRDLMSGKEVESEQIVGDLVARAGALGVPVPLLSLANTSLSVYRAERAARLG